MRRTAPAFWAKEPGLAADLLLPIGAVWDAAGRLRRAVAHPYRAPAPIVCVGNLVAGGTGKTPVTLALADWLGVRGVAPHIVTRGYGGRLSGPVQVDPVRHDFTAVGDEALLLGAAAPCWVARDRSAGVAAAIASGATAVLLDDGFQNPTIGKTLGLVVVDSAYGFGNRRVMPGGPLRENLQRGLARADGVILLAAEGDPAMPQPPGLPDGRPIIPAILAPVAGERLAGRRFFAFAGIGRPEKFFAALRRLGVELVGARPFSDHHPFRSGEMAALRRIADREQAQLVTTAKDFVRVPPAARHDIEVLEVAIRWPDPAALARRLAPIVLSAGGDGRDPEQNQA